MKRFSIFAAFVLALLTSIPVFAQDTQSPSNSSAGEKRKPVPRIFDRMDANDDRIISSDEWKRNPRIFDRADRNDNGSLSRREFGRAARRHGRHHRHHRPHRPGRRR